MNIHKPSRGTDRCPKRRTSSIFGHSDRAFSLVELVAILAIVAILGALAAPRFSKTIAVQNADALARRIVFDLTLAKQNAKSTGAAQAVRLWSDKYELTGKSHFDRSNEVYRVELDEAPYNAKLISVNFDNGDDTITFDAYGVADTGGTILIGVGNQRRTIAIDAVSGKAVVQ